MCSSHVRHSGASVFVSCSARRSQCVRFMFGAVVPVCSSHVRHGNANVFVSCSARQRQCVFVLCSAWRRQCVFVSCSFRVRHGNANMYLARVQLVCLCWACVGFVLGSFACQCAFGAVALECVRLVFCSFARQCAFGAAAPVCIWLVFGMATPLVFGAVSLVCSLCSCWACVELVLGLWACV